MNATGADAELTSETSPSRPRRRIARRIRIAEWLAFAGLVAACLAAIGPADKVRTTYSWPPTALPSGKPDREWYTPLLVAAQVPETLSADVPCQTASALRDADDPVTVLATSRSPDSLQRFAITRSDRELTYKVGGAILTRVPVDRAPTAAGCRYRITLDDGRWSLSGGAENLERGGDLGYMPVVSGLVSELDLRAGPAPTALVTTGVHATRTTTWQAMGWTAAALAIVTSLLLVTFAHVPRRPWRTLRTVVCTTVRAIRAVDVVVGVSLLAWWVLSPVFYDDGWTIARQRGFATSRGFSTYYNGLGTNLPNDYWLDWAQHWITQGFDTLVILRVPTLLCLAAVWVLCRWTLSRVSQDETSTRGLPEWVLAAAFLTGAMAWGMTLRPEPIIAVLVTATLVCAVWFSDDGGARPLALLAVLVPFAVTGHHAGVVALASLVVIAGPVVRWARTEFAAAVAIVISAFALLVMLAFVGSDIAQRADDAQATRVYGGVTETWRDEAARYGFLSVTVFANPVRRGWVALMGLAVLAFVLRRRRERASLDLASASLGVALVLLIATPSKWPWHFGALVGIAAVAVASETTRLRRDAADARGWSARPFVVVGAALLALVWAAGIRRPWNDHDLRSLDWTLSSSWFSAKTIAVGFGLLLAGAVVVTLRRRQPLADVPWRFATGAALLVTLPVTAFTVGMLVTDAVKTDGWTLTRQNLQSLRGDPGCGLADELLVPAMGSVRPLASAGGGRARIPAWLPPPPVEGVDRFALGPAPGGPLESSWYMISGDRPMGIFVSGAGSSNALSLEWGRNRRDGIESLGRGPVFINDGPHDERALPWRFALASELPQAPTDADAVRVVFEDRIPRGSAVGVSAPVAYTSETLDDRLGDSASTSLVHPTVLPYFPCVRQPAIRNGVAQPPDQLLTQPGLPNPVVTTGDLSPFIGLVSLYPLERLSLADSANPPTGSLLFNVDKRLQGAIEAPPDSATEAS